VNTSYRISPIAYLRRARACLDSGKQDALFYAAFELRSGTEARLQEYLDARNDIAEHRKQGWKIPASAKDLDLAFQLGDKIVEMRILNESGGTRIAAYYTPVTKRLSTTAGGRLHDILHAMKKQIADEAEWWKQTRMFLEQIYSDLAFACSGTLLGPVVLSPEGRMLLRLCFEADTPLCERISEFGVIGNVAQISFDYLDKLPEDAKPFLNPIP